MGPTLDGLKVCTWSFVTISPLIRGAQLLGDHRSGQVCTDIGHSRVRPDVSTGEQWLRRRRARAQPPAPLRVVSGMFM